MFSLAEYAYNLPAELIAQKPVVQRDQSKLLHLDRKSGNLAHHHFNQIGDFLLPTDILVINDTKVIPGRLYGRKSTGGKVEVLMLDYAGGKTGVNEFTGQCLVKASKPPKSGIKLVFDHGLSAEILEGREGVFTLKFFFQGNFEDLLYQIGHVPLPPYIKRDADEKSIDDKASYQTVYASKKGAVAAPTAGFHFTKELIAKIRAKGVKIASITLHIGYSTFLPVRVADIREHRMHAERFAISNTTANILNRAKAEGKRIVAVGTTCVRTLEFAADEKGKIQRRSGSCNLFIYPGYRFKVIDALITNFHLPRSTLLMLVAAFAGRERILHAYEEAIKKRYRFYSYGDAMMIA
jgi:S-adenosylmethionine:tRNA ribosyltransferase-isomerase